MNRRTGLTKLAALLALGSLAGALTACSENKPKFSAVDISGAEYARDFALTDHNGQPRTIKDFAGKVVVLFFGYTQCPDVCPTTLGELAEVKKLLGKDGARLQGLLVSIDPARDTPEVLKAYMENFDASFLALSTTPDKLPELAKEFKVYYRKSEGSTPTSYSMDHSAGAYVFDTQGKVRLYTRYGAGAAPLAADIRLLLGS